MATVHTFPFVHTSLRRSIAPALCRFNLEFPSKSLRNDLPRFFSQEVQNLAFTVKAHDLARPVARVFHGR